MARRNHDAAKLSRAGYARVTRRLSVIIRESVDDAESDEAENALDELDALERTERVGRIRRKEQQEA